MGGLLMSNSTVSTPRNMNGQRNLERICASRFRLVLDDKAALYQWIDGCAARAMAGHPSALPPLIGEKPLLGFRQTGEVEVRHGQPRCFLFLPAFHVARRPNAGRRLPRQGLTPLPSEKGVAEESRSSVRFPTETAPPTSVFAECQLLYP